MQTLLLLDILQGSSDDFWCVTMDCGSGVHLCVKVRKKVKKALNHPKSPATKEVPNYTHIVKEEVGGRIFTALCGAAHPWHPVDATVGWFPRQPNGQLRVFLIRACCGFFLFNFMNLSQARLGDVGDIEGAWSGQWEGKLMPHLQCDLEQHVQ